VIQTIVQQRLLSPDEVEACRRSVSHLPPAQAEAGLLQALRTRIPAEHHSALSAAYQGATVSGRPAPLASLSSSQVKVPAHVGAYRVERELARGGMGVVFVAVHRELGRRVALKLMLAGAGASEEDVQRFHLEAQAVARLRHPNIVGIHDVGVEDGQPYFAMDLIEGESLKERIEREGPLPAKDAARVVASLARALEYAHTNAILHRDVKPANVLLNAAGEPVLTDFGLARDANRDGMTVTGQALGTPAYMPPEQAAGELERIDRRADVYSLGATLFEALTGQPPFSGGTAINIVHKVLTKEASAPGSLRKGLDRELDTITLKCLEKEPEGRYLSAGRLADDLEHYLRDEPIQAVPLTSLQRLRKWTRRNRRLSAVILASFVLLSAGAFAAVVVNARAATSAREQLAEQAGDEAQAAWELASAAEIPSRAIGDASDVKLEEPLGLCLDAFVAAQRFHALEDSEASRLALSQAAERLGNVNLAAGQWLLAGNAFKVVRELAPARAAELSERLEDARAAGPRRRAAKVRALLAHMGDRALSAQRVEALREEVARFVEDQTVEILVEHLELLCGKLEAALASVVREGVRPTPSEAAALGWREIEGVEEALRAFLDTGKVGEGNPMYEALLRMNKRSARKNGPAWTRLVASRQRRVKPGERRRGDAICQLLGRLAECSPESVQRSARVLGRLLRTETSPTHALRAVEALAQLWRHEVAAAKLVEVRQNLFLHKAESLRGIVTSALGKAHYIRDLPLDSEDIPVLRLCAMTLEDRRLYPEAIQVLGRLIELDPAGEAIARQKLSRCLFEVGRFKEALVEAKHATRLKPNSAKAWRFRGLVLRELGQREEGVKCLDKAVILGPADPYVLFTRAEMRAELGNPTEKQIEDLNMALRALPTYAAAWSLRGKLFVTLRDYKRAESDLRRAIKLEPDNARHRARLGVFFVRRRMLPEARTWIEEALVINEKVSEVQLALASLELGQRNYEAAEEACTKALALDASSANAYLIRAKARYERHQSKGVIADLRACYRLAPYSALPFILLGEEAIRRGAYPEAVAAFAAAIKRHDGFAQSWALRGEAHRLAGKPGRSRADLDRALKLDAKYAQALAFRGGLRAEQGDAEGGVEDLKRALELEPDEADFWVRRARVYLKLEQFARAREDAAQGATLQPLGDGVGGFYVSALALEGLGQRAKAVAELRRFLASEVPRLAGDVKHARELLAEWGG
jgi:tetratricopeptide (TPR) repeat protein